MIATTDELAELVDLFAAIMRQVSGGTLTAHEANDALRSIVDRSDEAPQGRDVVADRFASGDEQVARAREWARILHLPLTSDQLDAAEAEMPAFEGDEPLIPLTLCWTLGDLGETIEAKLAIIRMVYGEEMVSVVREFRTDAKHTKLVGGAPAFIANRVWWQFIDLGANRFKAPSQVAPSTAAGSEVLDVICQHPIYVGQQDGSDTPYLDLPGLSVRVRGASGANTPDAVGGDTGRVAVRVRWDGGVYPDHAEPTREDEPEDPG